MRKNNFYISFGIWLIILPFLGIPGAWRNSLVLLSGLFLTLVSLGPIIFKKLQPKQKKGQDRINPQNASIKSDELRFSGLGDNQIETEARIEKEI